jgi:DNA polymerase I-like protein with 3'-5' exonuclease and polymerase domains
MIGGIRSKNIRMNKAATREAVNMPIQGSEGYYEAWYGEIR